MGLSLSDVKSRNITIEVSSLDGYTQSVVIGSLSYTEWHNCAIGVVFPSIPTPRMLTDKGMADVFNYNDPDYRNKLAIAESQVAFRRAVASLIKGGNFTELKDMSLDEQVEALQDMDGSLAEGVLKALNQLKLHTKGGVEAKKANFQDERVRESAQEHPESETQNAG